MAELTVLSSASLARCGKCGARVFRELEAEHGNYELTCAMGHLIGWVDIDGHLTRSGRQPSGTENIRHIPRLTT